MIETYRKAANRQLRGAMFHHDACQFFQFLGLCEFAEVQRKRYVDEQCTFDDIISRCLRKYGILIKTEYEDSGIISDEVYNTKAESVGNEYKRKALLKFVQKWKAWEDDTEKFYAEIIVSCKGRAEAILFTDLAKSVEDEIGHLHNLERLFELAGYDLVQVEKLSASSDV